MSQDKKTLSGPDLALGIASSELADGGMLVGHLGNDEILLVGRGAELFAVAAHCTHYHGPLADGLLAGDSVRCPWHHACFDLRTGEALHAPAMDRLTTWDVEERDGKISVRAKPVQPPLKARW